MADIQLPADLTDVLADYERRIRTLETSPRLQNSTQPWQSDYTDAAESTSSLVYTNLATVGPTITMNVPKTTTNASGDIGRVLLTVSAYINAPSNTSATVGLFIDGVLTWDALLALGNSGPATLAMNVTDMRTITVTPGTHTFQLKYKQSLTTAQFAARLLIVQPF